MINFRILILVDNPVQYDAIMLNVCAEVRWQGWEVIMETARSSDPNYRLMSAYSGEYDLVAKRPGPPGCQGIQRTEYLPSSMDSRG